MAEAITLVQQRLGVRQTGSWDKATDGAVLAFQQRKGQPYPMDPTGRPDGATLANLGYFSPGEVFPAKWDDYLAGGEKPGTFARDLETALDQVPRWAWGVMAVAFGSFAYMAWRTDRKRRGAG